MHIPTLDSFDNVLKHPIIKGRKYRPDSVQRANMGSPIHTQIWIAGLTFLIAGGIILPIVRREYLKRGKLSHSVAILQLVLWFFYQVFLALTVFGDLWPPAEAYELKNRAGGFFMLLGMGICVAGMWAFRSLNRATGRETSRLVIVGIYRYTRNPQYLGYGLVILGAVIGYWSSTAWLAFIAYALLITFTVKIEEEHLTQVFGEDYKAYCRRVPRYVTMSKREMS